MPGSFRLLPPEPRPDLLARPRLIRTLLGRWECRVTALVGGAGLGKTTVLAQAIAENRLSPRGEDLWFGLEPQDADADRLARAVVAVVATPASDDERLRPGARAVQGPPTPAAVAELLWQRAPTELCLTFDDVHRLPAGSSGAGWLAGRAGRPAVGGLPPARAPSPDRGPVGPDGPPARVALS